jgi:glucose/arabinose dehydrogenase
MNRMMCLCGVALAGAAWTGAARAQTIVSLPDHVELIKLPLPSSNWLWAGSPPGDRSRVFAMDRTSGVRALDVTYDRQGRPTYTLRTLPARVGSTSQQGRSMAFAPDFEDSGQVYVAIAQGGTTDIVSYRVSALDSAVFDLASARLVLRLSVSGDHAVGSMHFGSDGMLYIGVGDGFSYANGQQQRTTLGKMLRIDPRGPDAFPEDPLRNYAIPADNPYANHPTNAREIWHYGVRNPWRWSFDRWNGDMWVVDVGESSSGDFSRVPATRGSLLNFGWPNFDGGPLATQNLPVGWTEQTTVRALYNEFFGCSSSGGVLYRGSDIRSWRGRFLWGDYCANILMSALPGATAFVNIHNATSQLNVPGVTSWPGLRGVVMIAEDGAGELLIVDYNGSSVYRVAPNANIPRLADVAGSGQTIGADGQLTADDLIVYINWYFAGAPEADVGGPASRWVDQQVTPDDIILFIHEFFLG